MRDLVRPAPVSEEPDQEWPVNVGTAAKLSGLTPKMVRHYEAQGLLGEIRRSGGGYRLYSRDDVQTLRFIYHCRLVDFSLDDIEQLLQMWRSGGNQCDAAKTLADRHMELLECRISEIRFMQQALRDLASRCSNDDSCPLLDGLSEKTTPPARSPRHGCCDVASTLRNL